MPMGLGLNLRIDNLARIGAAPAAAGAETLLENEADGLAADFTNSTMQIKDTVTPANNYNSVPFSKLTFTRAAPDASYYDSAGLIAYATTNIPRIDYNPATLVKRGFMTEESRVNNFTRSEDLTHARWVKAASTVSGNAIAAPDGATTADKLVESATSAQHYTVFDGDGFSGTGGSVYSWSIFAKQGERTWIWLEFYGGFSAGTAYVNLATGAIGATSGIGSGVVTQAVGNGFYRVMLPNATATAAAMNVAIYTSTGDGVNNYAGDGASGVYLWGSQLELGAFVTSYIPTVAAAVTRAADVCTIATTLFNHSATLGTLYLNSIPMYVGSIQTGLLFDDGTGNELFRLGNSAAAAASFSVIDGGAAQTAPLTTGTVAVGTADKIAAAWAVNDFALSKDGAAPATDTSGTLPTVTTLRIGANRWMRQIMHLPRNPSDAQLQTLTT